jgi:hypothetical protein
MQKVHSQDGRGRHPSRAARNAHQHSQLLAGGAAGVTRLLVFLVILLLWIVPIWFTAPAEVVLSSVGGIVIGRTFGELKSVLPQGIMCEDSLIAAGKMSAILVAVMLCASIVLVEIDSALSRSG